jgi:hypothetical protein
MSSGGTGGGGIVLAHAVTAQGTKITKPDLQRMCDLLTDDDVALKNQIQFYLNSLPAD